MGKGSSPRPFKVSNEEYSNRWDAIFGRDNAEKNKEKSNLESGESNLSCDSGCVNNPQGEAGQTPNDGVFRT
jgi:hypothetical protein